MPASQCIECPLPPTRFISRINNNAYYRIQSLMSIFMLRIEKYWKIYSSSSSHKIEWNRTQWNHTQRQCYMNISHPISKCIRRSRKLCTVTRFRLTLYLCSVFYQLRLCRRRRRRSRCDSIHLEITKNVCRFT